MPVIRRGHNDRIYIFIVKQFSEITILRDVAAAWNAWHGDIDRDELRRLGRRTVDAPRKKMGSLDMGNVSQVVPSIHPYVAIAPRSVPLHSRGFARLQKF